MDPFCSLYQIFHYLKSNSMLSKSSKCELGLVHYIAKFTISRFVISRFECIWNFLQWNMRVLLSRSNSREMTMQGNDDSGPVCAKKMHVSRSLQNAFILVKIGSCNAPVLSLSIYRIYVVDICFSCRTKVVMMLLEVRNWTRNQNWRLFF